MNDLPSGERDAVVHEIRLACEREDAPTLHTQLAPDVVALIDTGGDLIASTWPLTGDEVVPRLLDALDGAGLSVQQVNGVCAIVARRGERVSCIVSFGFEGNRIARVWITLSPLKLRRWNS